MRFFVITIPYKRGVDESISRLSNSMADACITSGKRFGVDIEKFPASTYVEAQETSKQFGLFPAEGYQLSPAELGCFLSHYRLWQVCCELNQPVIILEHDGKLVHTITLPREINTTESVVMSIAKPGFFFRGLNGSFMLREKYRHKLSPGINLHRYDYLAGTQGYLITPAAAHKITRSAQINGYRPADAILRKSNEYALLELFPHPVVGQVDYPGEFSTIRNPGTEKDTLMITRPGIFKRLVTIPKLRTTLSPIPKSSSHLRRLKHRAAIVKRHLRVWWWRVIDFELR